MSTWTTKAGIAELHSKEFGFPLCRWQADFGLGDPIEPS
jgi:hypothetical protein